jgi:hypothetical protein
VTAHVTGSGSHWQVSGISYTPTWARTGDYTVLPVATALNDRATPPALRALLTASWHRTVSAITLLGAAAGNVRPDLVPRTVGSG